MKPSSGVLAASAGALLLMVGCSSPAPSKAPVTYENGIRQLTVKQCRECHGPKSPMLAEFKKDKKGYKEKDLGPRMDSYDTLIIFVNGSDTGALHLSTLAIGSAEIS